MSNKIICTFHDTQDHSDDQFQPDLPRRQFTREADQKAAVRMLVNSCLNWGMRPTQLVCGTNQIHHRVEYRSVSRKFGQRVEPKLELVTFTGPRLIMLPLLKLAAHQKVLMDNAPHVPDAPMPPLVLAHLLNIPFDSTEFENVRQACKVNHRNRPDGQEPVIRDMSTYFASLLIGEPEIVTVAEAQADSALGLAS